MGSTDRVAPVGRTGADPQTAEPTSVPASRVRLDGPEAGGPDGLVGLAGMAGNRSVTRLIEGTGGGPAIGDASTVSPALGSMLVQRQAVQRDDASTGGTATATATPAPGGTGVTVTFAGLQVSTFAELLAAGRMAADSLQNDVADLPQGDTARAAAEQLIAQAKGWEPTLISRGTAPLDQAVANQATVWNDAFRKAGKDVERSKKAIAKADLEKAAAEADTAREALDKLPDEMAELQRAAFLSSKTELLEKILHVLGPALQVSSALLEVHEQASELNAWLGMEASHASELVEKIAPFAEAAHKVTASLEVLTSGMVLLGGGEGATEIDKSMSKVSAGFGLASAVGSLSGIGAPYMVYYGAVLSTAQKLLAVLAKILREQAHTLNQVALSEGKYDEVDWDAEPGGRETFDFMLLVRNADSPEDIPSGIPKAVDELIVDKAENLEAGTGEEVPTTGHWFWKHADKGKIRTWLFENRQNVWAMLYGSVVP